MDISNLIKDTYLSYISRYRTGLVLAPLPTAIGKTYSACQAMAEFVADVVAGTRNDGRKLVFTTSLLKNLPEEDLKKAFAERGMSYDDDVVYVKSNKDCISEAVDNGYFDAIPEELQKGVTDTDNFQAMKDCLARIRRADGTDGREASKDEKELVEIKYMPQFVKAERNFRKAIHVLLCNIAKAEHTTIEDLAYHHKDFEWLRKTYPQVLEDNYKVFLMSTMKLLQGQCSILRRIGYMSEEWLQDKVLFIDEVDYTKSDFISYILRDAKRLDNVREAIDVRLLFRSIRDGLASDQLFSHLPKEAWKSLNSRFYNRERLLKDAQDIEEKYNILLPYRITGNRQEYTPYFLYRCGSWLTASRQDNDHYIWAVENKGEECMDLCKGDREEWVNAKGKTSLNAMLTAIDRFIGHFVHFVSYWALAYSDLENKRRAEDEAEFTYANAVTTLLYKFHLSPEERSLLLNTYHLIQRPSHDAPHVRTASFYSSGAEWFSFFTGEETYDDTVIRMFKVTDTAESLMLFLAKHCLCIGLSATALCPSVIGNYSLRYLRNELSYEDKDCVRHKDFHDMIAENPALGKAIRDELDAKYKKYNLPDDNVDKICIDEIVALDNTYDGSQYDDSILDKFFPDTDDGQQTAAIIESRIRGAVNNYIQNTPEKAIDNSSYKYFVSRYCNIARVIFSFAGHREHQSCLCLCAKLPEAEDSTLGWDAIRETTDYVNAFYEGDTEGWLERENVIPFMIDSKNFRRKKKDFDKLLTEGKRLFVISTYQTIAAGQNLQHGICDWVKPFLRKLDGNDGRDTTKKDIDELALLDYTNVVVNLNNPERLSVSEQLNNIIQTEECYEESCYAISEKNGQIRNGLKKMASRGLRYGNIINDTNQVGLQRTHWVVQADGRTKRSPWRTRHQQIYIDTRLLDSLDAGYMESILPYASPELKAIYKKRQSRNIELAKDDQKYVQDGMRKSQKARVRINDMLSSIDLDGGIISWPELYYKEWNSWRDKVLKHPSGIDDEMCLNDVFFRDFYIQTPPEENAISYYYYSISDFRETYLSFGNRQDFQQRVMQKLEKMKLQYDRRNNGEVSMEKSRLAIMLRYKGLKEYFIKKGYATEWIRGRYIMSPVIYQEIYLGALGEAAGKFIIEDNTTFRLLPITDKTKFEAFDAVIDGLDGVYIDFKHYQYLSVQEDDLREEYSQNNKEKILRKMDIIGAKAAFIIGIIAPEGERMEAYRDGNIYYIPQLIHNDGTPDLDNIERLNAYLRDIKEGNND